MKMSTRQKNILVPKSMSHLENLDHVHLILILRQQILFIGQILL